MTTRPRNVVEGLQILTHVGVASQILDKTNVLHEVLVDCQKVMAATVFRTTALEGDLLLVSRRDSRLSPSQSQLKCLPLDRATPADPPLHR